MNRIVALARTSQHRKVNRKSGLRQNRAPTEEEVDRSVQERACPSKHPVPLRLLSGRARFCFLACKHTSSEDNGFAVAKSGEKCRLAPAGMVTALLPNLAATGDAPQPTRSFKAGPNRDSREVHQRDSTSKES